MMPSNTGNDRVSRRQINMCGITHESTAHGVWQSEAPVTALLLGKPVAFADNEGSSRVAKLIFVSNPCK